MCDFASLENEFHRQSQTAENMRAKTLWELSSLTGRNTIAYYSGFLTCPPNVSGLEINDLDINAFMNVTKGMDCKKGLDLILHTPGGGIAATEHIVTYLRSRFGTDIRCFVPQIAMSAGTMLACACKQIVMGRQSCLGPIDPQYLGCACHGVIEEFDTATQQIQKNPATIAVWRPIIEKYHPTFLGECKKAIDLSKDLVAEWLATGMFEGRKNAKRMASSVVKQLADHGKTKTHNRHIPASKAASLGLNIVMLEGDQALQDRVLAIHHCFMLTFMHTPAIKIVESDFGRQFKIHHNPR